MSIIAQEKNLIKKTQKVDVYKFHVKIDRGGNLTPGGKWLTELEINPEKMTDRS